MKIEKFDCQVNPSPSQTKDAEWRLEITMIVSGLPSREMAAYASGQMSAAFFERFGMPARVTHNFDEGKKS